jgi:hypothetical protein
MINVTFSLSATFSVRWSRYTGIVTTVLHRTDVEYFHHLESSVGQHCSSPLTKKYNFTNYSLLRFYPSFP